MPVYNGTTGVDHIFGSTGADTINGYAGNDFLSGNAGSDAINGGDGSDTIFGGDGNDSLFGGEGSDTIYGDGGNDTINGGIWKDYIYADDGDDIIVVDDTSDYIFSSGDDIDGGSGLDILRLVSTSTSGSTLSVKLGKISYVEHLQVLSPKDLVVQGAGKIDISGISSYETSGGKIGHIWGSSGNDTISGFNFSNVRDTITGGAGNDVINGYNGDDYLWGDGGNDILSGDMGNDNLRGGTGTDTFLFSYTVNQGNDVLNDYVDGADKIKFSGAGGTASFSSLSIMDVGANSIINFGAGTVITVENVSSLVFDSSDFIFA